MEIAILILQIVLMLGLVLVSLFSKSYFPKYLEEKGKNTATKEDIEEITLKVEKVKAIIEKDVFIHQIQFEKEFNAYTEIWVNIPDLTSHMMSYDDVTTIERIKKREKELPGLFEKTNKLISENEPFLHPSVFELCLKFLNQITEFAKLDRRLRRIEEQINVKAVKNSDNIIENDDKRWSDLYDQWTNILNGIVQQKKDINNSIRQRIWNLK